ncbi:Rieske (2Fe-2S) protein [Nocardia transvalensis]|uniref:Rieske (2Fe-2S) protein n=1 Tax=Nocardia transvalensis TaxID=37333 RepID=UPI002B4B7C49|nr:Rieske 2Fe-2S domain-containing protein [Nocardia transvalensis]
MTALGGTAIVVGRTEDIPELGRLVVDVGDRTIGIFRVQGRLYAYDNTCAHQGGPVCQGRILPKVRENLDADKRAHGMVYDRSEMHIVCPWHGAEYVITTGVHAAAPDLRLNPVDVEERGGEIYVVV